jgi:hypothetical protein
VSFCEYIKWESRLLVNTAIVIGLGANFRTPVVTLGTQPATVERQRFSRNWLPSCGRIERVGGYFIARPGKLTDRSGIFIPRGDDSFSIQAHLAAVGRLSKIEGGLNGQLAAKPKNL